MAYMEILAPAGSVGALQAAVRCGAAAVYLGSDAFNARKNAENFAGDALREAVAYCHVRGVKVYLTLNTLIKEHEFTTALELAERAQSFGVDALILQDVGLARYLSRYLPQMPLHASTQLTCHTPDGVRFLKKNGFCRVVLSREMSLEEIKRCGGLGCELEVFVHGALCMCVSGQCYLSAMLGGRSGNRGLCAQPCRLPFSAEGTLDLTGGYALSLKDQSIVREIAALSKAGVLSFKIEGRMKRPEYVAAAVSVCRAAAEGETISAEMLADLEAVFSRSGFTDGYFTAHRGTAMFGTRTHEDVTAASAVLKKLSGLYAKERQSVGVTMQLTAAVGDPTVLTVSDTDGNIVTVEGAPAETAQVAATTPEKAEQQLKKTGGTPFAATVCAYIAEGAMVPASVLNGLRREALLQLEAVRGVVLPRTVANPPADYKTTHGEWPYGRLIRLQTAAQYSVVLRNETVILPLFTKEETLRAIADTHKGAFGVEIPRGLFGGTAAALRALETAKACGAAFVLCGNVNAVEIARKSGLVMVGGFGMNITNQQAVAFYAENGFAALTVSPELSFAQMRFAEQAAIPCGVLAYGRLPLMLTRNCPRKAAGADCAVCKGDGVLVDRKQVRFPIVCENGCSELLNSVPTYWGDKPNALPKTAFYLYHFTDETAERVAEVLHIHEENSVFDQPATRGMYRDGVL